MKRIPFLLAAVLLTGCLLTQNDPASVPTRPYLLGVVSAESMQVANQGAIGILNAEFAIKLESAEPEKNVSSSLATTEGRQNAVAGLLAPPSRIPACRKARYEKTPPPAAQTEPSKPAAPSTLKRVSVGNLGFGPALQQSLIVLRPGKDLKYSAVLDPAIPAGAYQILSDGATDVDPLSEILSFPEEVRFLRVGGQNFGDPVFAWDPSRGLEVLWREPGIVNDQNGILIEASVDDGKIQYELSCAAREEDIPAVGGDKRWNLDSAWFSEFPKQGKVSFYFIRAHLRMPETKRTKFQMQGSRTFFSRFDIQR
jgi:hypothetical protein